MIEHARPDPFRQKQMSIAAKLFFLSLISGVFAFVGHAQNMGSQTARTPRKGQVELQVWDRSTKQFIYAGLGIYPVKVRDKKFAAMSTSTGDDGSTNMLSLAPGRYTAKVERYICNGKRYFSAKAPSFGFVVKAEHRHRKKLKVDVSKIRAAPSYDNPSGTRCPK
jgi:hypothetical protein